MNNSDALDALFQNTDSDAWRDLIDGGQEAMAMPRDVDPAIYAACFSSPAGRAVLEDLYNRYVNVTRAVPGQGAELAFYREGAAQVVFEIAQLISQAQEQDHD